MNLLAVSIVGTLVGAALVLGGRACTLWLSERLLRATLVCLPENLDAEVRARWSEEFEADLASYADRPISGLVFALRARQKGCRGLVPELVPQRTPAATQNTQDDTKIAVPGNHDRTVEAQIAWERALKLKLQIEDRARAEDRRLSVEDRFQEEGIRINAYAQELLRQVDSFRCEQPLLVTTASLTACRGA